MKKAYKNPDAVTYYIKEREYFGWRPRGERAVKFAEIKPGDYVLDLCCGPGMVSKVIREFVGDKGKVIGIDISPKFIKYANQLCNYPNVSFFKGNVENFDTYTHAEKFDAIVLLASWYWIKNKDQLLKKIKLNCHSDDTFTCVQCKLRRNLCLVVLSDRTEISPCGPK